MAKQEFLTLAHDFEGWSEKYIGWLASEKLDGMRAFWDGGISRGKHKSEIPWANTAKDNRYKDQSALICTGLWSRYGNIIHAPSSWLDNFPDHCLDGELYSGLTDRQRLMTIVKRLEPLQTQWQDVKYHVFDIPTYQHVFRSRQINNTNFKIWIDESKIRQLFPTISNNGSANFEWYFRKVHSLIGTFSKHPVIKPIMQCPVQSEDHLYDMLHGVCKIGGEGLIIRNPKQPYYLTERTHDLLKLKHVVDVEGVVVGCKTGEQTMLGSKLLGLMGSLLIKFQPWPDKTVFFELSGFTDNERILIDTNLKESDLSKAQMVAKEWAIKHPGTVCPTNIQAIEFPIGVTITFKYRELSKTGVPIEARYWRK